MLTPAKKAKLLHSLKGYSRKYLSGKTSELDESGTRLMINTFLTEVLEFLPIDEVKTEYMIRGTYADYVIQAKGVRHFLVEVKALSFGLSEKHLRQTINYGANEGIEWALLTNGKCFDFYKILFNKPIESRKIFSLDLSDTSSLKTCAEVLQFIHRESIMHKGLNMLWNKTCALDPINVSGLLFAQPVINFLKRTLKLKFRSRFSDDEIKAALNRIIYENISLDEVKPSKSRRTKRRTIKEKKPDTPLTDLESQNSEEG